MFIDCLLDLGPVQGTFIILPPLLFRANLSYRCFYSHFSNEETETLKQYVTCPSFPLVISRLEIRSQGNPDFESLLLSHSHTLYVVATSEKNWFYDILGPSNLCQEMQFAFFYFWQTIERRREGRCCHLEDT